MKNVMNLRYLLKASIFISLCLITFTEAQGGMNSNWASTDTKDSSTGLNQQNQKASEKSWFDKIDSRWGGRFKVEGLVSSADDDSIYKPVGTGTYFDGIASLRLTNETFFSDSVFFEIQFESILAGGDTVRKHNELEAFFPNLPEGILIPGAPLNDDRRLMDLTAIHEQDSYFWINRLDRLYLALMPDWGAIRIGRQAITLGNGLIFNPMDLFNPFPPAAIDRDYKVGDDMVTAQIHVPSIGDFQTIWVIRRNPVSGDVEPDQNSLAGTLHFETGTTDFDIMATKHYSDYVIGAGATGYLGDAAWRMDVTWTFLQDSENSDYLSLVANMDYSWVWLNKNCYGLIEFYFNGLGETDYKEALTNPDIVERLSRGELFVLDRYYLSGSIQMELHPLFNVYFTSINNVVDPSGILQPRAVWDITQNLQMTFGVNFTWGAKGTEFGGFTIPGTDLLSRSPNNAYAWLSYYF